MNKQSLETKNSIYAGMSIYCCLKNYITTLDDKIVSLEDKKYLSLYLGIIATDNNISRYLKSINFNLNIEYMQINLEKYLELYNDYFVEIFKELSFEDIEYNIEYLNNKNIIKKFNEIYKLPIIKAKEENKKLVKQIL